MARIGVQIVGDSTSLERAFKRSEIAAAEFNGRMNRLGQATRGALQGTGTPGGGAFLFGSGSFIAAAAATAAITKTVSAASDLNEQVTKSQAVFGQSAQSVRDWSRTTADAFGVSQKSALEASGTFGNLFRTVDITGDKAAEMSRKLVELGADLASFNNANIDDVLLAIRSGLIGEAEPLRRFGVLLSETRVQQQALIDTGKTNVKSLTDQEKALARYNIILQDTVPAQGDFAKTSEGLANQTRILKANLADLAANLGTVFLPAVNAAVGGLNNLFDAFDAINNLTGGHFSIDVDTTSVSELDALSRKFAELNGEGSLAAEAFRKAAERLRELKTAAAEASRGEGRTAASVEASNALVEAREAEQAARKRKNTLAKAKKDFEAFAKGLGLKLDKAALSGSIDAQIAVLREFEDAIQRRERRVGKTFELESKLTQVRQQIQDLQDEKHTAALAKQEDQERKILGLKEKQRQALQEQLQKQKELRAQAKAALDEATQAATSLFGTLFQAPEQAQRTLTVLGGSKGKQTLVLPGAGGGEDAKGLLADLTAQIKSFKTLQASILELQRKGAPKSLLAAARSGEISADQINALAKANSATLNQIFKNVRLADKLISRAAKAEIHAKDVSLRANTVTVRGALAASGGGGARESGFVVNGGIHLHGVQNVKQLENELERRRKKRTQQTRGRSGGKR